MRKRNLLAKALCLFFAQFIALAVQAKSPSYPAIVEWQGQAWVTGKDGKRVVIKAKQVLREKALIETSLLAEVKVQLDEKRTMVLLGASEVLIPVISWEGGEAPVVILKNGELHWHQAVGEKGAYNIALRSDLFEFLAPAGDYILSIYPDKAFAGVKVFEGSMEFSALNGEESASVTAGKQVGFQGVLEGGEIAYDVLLKGKKIPRGHLTAVSPIDTAEVAKAAEAEKKRKKAEAVREQAKKAAKEKLKREGVICQDPAGRFNECAWVCLNNPKKEKKACLLSKAGVSCVRRRCNANGVWAEEMTLDAEKASSSCKAQPVVAPCDY